MSPKCEACGIVAWVGETSCGRCGAELTAKLIGGVYSGNSAKRQQAINRHSRISPFFKALLYSFVIEFVVLLFTIEPVVNSIMRHSRAGSSSLLSDFLAYFGFLFHYPSLFISIYLSEQIIFAPLIQIALMTAVLTLIFRWRASKRKF